MNKNIASDWYEEIEFEGLDSFALDKSADNTADKTYDKEDLCSEGPLASDQWLQEYQEGQIIEERERKL